MTRAEMTYDQRRDTPARCRCGWLVTRPELCDEQQRCLFGQQVLTPWRDRLHRGQPDSSEGCE